MQTTQETLTQRGIHEGHIPAKLDPRAFGLTCGTLWGVGLFSLTWWIIALDGSSEEPTALGKLYRGYKVTPRGSVIGLVWGFFDALVGGMCFAWLYNGFTASKRSR